VLSCATVLFAINARSLFGVEQKERVNGVSRSNTVVHSTAHASKYTEETSQGNIHVPIASSTGWQHPDVSGGWRLSPLHHIVGGINQNTLRTIPAYSHSRLSAQPAVMANFFAPIRNSPAKKLAAAQSSRSILTSNYYMAVIPGGETWLRELLRPVKIGCVDLAARTLLRCKLYWLFENSCVTWPVERVGRENWSANLLRYVAVRSWLR
jgi:hypothetical protein